VNPLEAIACPLLGFPPKYVTAPAFATETDETERFVATTLGTGVDPSKLQYANVPDEVIRYVLGLFGRPTRPVDPEVRDKILSRARAAELAAEPPPPTLADYRQRFGKQISDEELLLRAVMPQAQVDAMVTAGPARRHYNPELAPVLSLLDGLRRRKIPTELTVEQPGSRLSLRCNAEHEA